MASENVIISVFVLALNTKNSVVFVIHTVIVIKQVAVRKILLWTVDTQ